MQIYNIYGIRLRDAPHSSIDHWAVMRKVLVDVCEMLPFPKTYTASGQVEPPPGATISHTPRVVLCMAGRNVMQIPVGADVTEIALNPGDAVFIHADAWNRPLNQFPLRFFVLDFGPGRTRYMCREQYQVGAHPGEMALCFRHGAISSGAEAILAAINGAIREDAIDLVVPMLVAALVAQARHDFTNAPSSVTSISRATWLRACEIINEQLHTGLTRFELASQLAIHPNHVSRLFRQFAQVSFSQYLTQCRLELAVKLMQAYSLPVGEIAVRCGYQQASYFSTVFKRHFGESPGRFRANLMARVVEQKRETTV